MNAWHFGSMDKLLCTLVNELSQPTETWEYGIQQTHPTFMYAYILLVNVEALFYSAA